MKYILFAVLAAIGLMTALFGLPPQIKQIWNQYDAPPTAKQNEARYQAIADEFNRSYRPETDCVKPHNELKKVECRNRDEMAFRSFVRIEINRK
jgi:hypothetical protein